MTFKRRPRQPIPRRSYSRAIRRRMSALALMSLSFFLTTIPAIAQAATQEAPMNGGFSLQQLLTNALQWIDGLGAVGAIAFIAIYIIATVAFLPGSVLTLGAGVLFGVVKGSTLVFLGATLGATAAFLVGRYIARDWVAKKIEGNRKFKAIDDAVGREGLKIVLLTRLSPIFPFNLLNYAFGLTGVSLKDYFIGCIGMLPGTVMYVYLGSLAGNLAMIAAGNQPENAGIQWAIRIIGFIATVAVTFYVTRIARRALNEAVAEEQPELDTDQSTNPSYNDNYPDSGHYSDPASTDSSATP